MNEEFINAIIDLEQEKGIDAEILFSAIETALITVTMLLLFGLMIYVSFNDILRLFGK